MLPVARKPPNKRRNVIVAFGALFLLVVLFMPRWRHAISCTMTGGRWTSANMMSYLEKGCRVKSKTAGKPCTGQLRDECERSLCDLSLKHPTAGGRTAAGGTCPAYWVKQGYDKEGKFRTY